MFYLIIKGTREDAERATKERNIPYKFEHQWKHNPHSKIYTTRGITSADHLTIAKYFGEYAENTPGYGFPDGTLLLYSEVK